MSVEDQNPGGNAKNQDCSYGFKESRLYQQWERPFVLNSDKDSVRFESEFKSHGPMSLAEETSGQCNIQSVAWLLVTFH